MSSIIAAAFAESIAAATGARRGIAWGGGGGMNMMLGARPFSIGMDVFAGVNRPEALAILPSSQDGFELRVGLFLRGQN